MAINPNGMNKRGGPNNAGMQQNAQGQGKNSHFDPITSLTQMSNLLTPTNNVAGSINGQPPSGVFMQGGRNNAFINSPHGMHGMGNELNPQQQQQQHHMQQQQVPHHMQQQDCAMPGMAGSPMECGGIGGMNAGQFPPMHNQMNPHVGGNMQGMYFFCFQI